MGNITERDEDDLPCGGPPAAPVGTIRMVQPNQWEYVGCGAVTNCPRIHENPKACGPDDQRRIQKHGGRSA